jgi:outer membrane protein assembly factor BamA
VVALLVRAATAEPEQTGTETGLVPLVGGDTDIGFGAGAIGSIASFDGVHAPYRWQLQFATFVAAKADITSPSYEDVYLNLIIPQLLGGRLRLEVRPSFTNETALPFYGTGNTVRVPSNTVPARDFYTRLHPQLTVMTRWQLGEGWSAIGGLEYMFNQTTLPPGSTAAMEVPAIDPNAKDPQSIIRAKTGLVYDTRDNELAPNRGMLHSFEIRVSPRFGDAVPYSYDQLDLTLRWYTHISDRNVLAMRLVGDALVGNVPFYELSRYEDTSAIGGGSAVRGVPAYTFYGNVKLFGNVELRTDWTSFHAFDRNFKLGVASFVDAGRLWADSATDGNLVHWGVGGGLRLQQGRAFLVRADVAWSPDARPVAGYLLADHIF